MDENAVACYRRAGEIASEVRRLAGDYIKSGMKLIDIANWIDAKIVELGGDFGFPVNLSLNEIAAHYTPESGDETLAEGLLKIDLGVSVEGYIADCAFSLDLSEDGEFGDLLEENKRLLSEVRKIVRPGMKVREVGNLISDKVEKFTIIGGLSGHSLDKDEIHAGLTIPNYANNSEKELNDMAFAVEPFLTTGSGEIYEGKGGGIYLVKKEGAARDKDAREILKYVKENWKSRPFCVRWLEKAGFERAKFVISILVRQGIIYEFPQLIEKTRAPVSQFEDSFVVFGDEAEAITNW